MTDLAAARGLVAGHPGHRVTHDEEARQWIGTR